MGKKSRKSSKSKKKGKEKSKSKKSGKPSVKVPRYKQIDPEVLRELTKDLQDVFRFRNGDVYMGHFAITADGGVIRQGRGKYYTSDGVTMDGRWEADVLVEAEKVSFPDGSWYTGPLEADRYAGLGAYGVPQLGTLRGDFVQGRPLGVTTLSDGDGQTWQGLAVVGSLTLLPRNHLFDSEDALCKAAACENKDSFKSHKTNLSQEIRLSKKISLSSRVEVEIPQVV